MKHKRFLRFLFVMLGPEMNLSGATTKKGYLIVRSTYNLILNNRAKILDE